MKITAKSACISVSEHNQFSSCQGETMLLIRRCFGWGVLMALAGLVWLLYLSPPLVHHLIPYNTAVGLVAEALPILWLLAMGVNEDRWREQAAATGRRAKGV